jgi:hypothetical protein
VAKKAPLLAFRATEGGGGSQQGCRWPKKAARNSSDGGVGGRQQRCRWQKNGGSRMVVVVAVKWRYDVTVQLIWNVRIWT